MNLPPLVQTFVLHFGEMGGRWGVNRTVGQIYAVLFVSPEPLAADDIVEALGVSRSNVSMGLKELQAWNLVRLQHRPGDRREFFSAPEDLWQIVRTLVEERKKREIDPTLSMLREALMERPESDYERHAQERMRAMHDLMDMMADWYDDIRRIETERLVQLMKLGARITRVLEAADKLSFMAPGKKKPVPEEAPPRQDRRTADARPGDRLDDGAPEEP